MYDWKANTPFSNRINQVFNFFNVTLWVRKHKNKHIFSIQNNNQTAIKICKTSLITQHNELLC